MADHERIWLEPAPGADEEYGRQWMHQNVWGDDATEYVRAEKRSGNPKAADAQFLRATTEEMANIASVPMELWNHHSNACLDAALALEANQQVIETLRAALERECGGLELLRRAVEAGDPKSELLFRINDLISALAALSDNPNGENHGR